MNTEKAIRLPMSRFKRELNTLTKRLSRGDIDIIYVTVNNVKKVVCISPERYHLFSDQVETLQARLGSNFDCTNS